MSALDRLELSENEVHLWFAFPNEIRDEALLQRYHGFLTPEEAHQRQRFHFEKHRHQYLITRALIRTLLSRYEHLAPADWRFEKNQYGRPHISPTHTVKPLHFNLSHTEGLIACAVVLNREVGVDVEDIRRGGDLIQIADRFFSPREVEDLMALPAEHQESRFFDYWTLKESYIKARGMGLSIPLDQFSFHLERNQPRMAISIDERQNDPPERWQFKQWELAPGYRAALALERKPGLHFPIIIRKTVPLQGDAPIELRETRGNFD